MLFKKTGERKSSGGGVPRPIVRKKKVIGRNRLSCKKENNAFMEFQGRGLK